MSSPALDTDDDEALAGIIAARQASPQALRNAQDACRTLYQRHARMLLAFLAARLPPHECEDVHQVVWQRVWEHLPTSFQGGNFAAWLFQIARRLVIDQVRKKKPQA